MVHGELHSYRFEHPPQWRAGVFTQLTVDNHGLRAPARLALEPLPGTTGDDATAALSTDPCGEIHWVRSDSFELLRALPGAPLVLTRLDVGLPPEAWQATGLALGPRHLWLLLTATDSSHRPRLLCYLTGNFQRLASIELERPVLAFCGDHADGAWLVVGGDGDDAELIHVEPGMVQFRSIPLPTSLVAAALAVDRDSGMPIVLDPKPRLPPHETPLAWRLWRVASGKCRTLTLPLYALPERYCDPRQDAFNFRPELLAVDPTGEIHLMSTGGMLWTLNAHGEVLAQHPAVAPLTWSPIRGLLAGENLVLSGVAGIAHLQSTGLSQATPLDAVPTYITPQLVSPDGVERGWMRADLEVDMAPGTTLELSVAASRDNQLIEEIARLFANTAIPPDARLALIDAQLPWRDAMTMVYRSDGTTGEQRLRFPLHPLEDTHLWLRIRMQAPANTPAPRLRRLQVRYPNRSYARYLPAVYQEDQRAFQDLRRLLAVFESLFGDFDERLATLPEHIDPHTAPDDWLAFLLRWLGLPAPTELDTADQRRLLISAPQLLRDRGTVSALNALLEILVGENFSVTDSGAGPPPWTLPTNRGTAHRPRLGHDTLLLTQPRKGFRLGRTAQLGQQPLGYRPLDPLPSFARRSGAIEIRVLDSPSREQHEALLHRFLPFFIPAHCRYHLRFVGSDGLGRGIRLDDSLRLQAEGPSKLGNDTRLGGFRLPHSTDRGITLGPSTFLDDGLYLS